MTKFNINDKVKLKNPLDIHNFPDYGVKWQKFWYDNPNTMFTVSYINVNSINNEVYYILKYLNGKKVRYIFYCDELEPYIHNILPDDLFDI